MFTLIIAFTICVAIYALAVQVAEVMQQKARAKARMEQVIFEGRLNNLVKKDRNALPTNTWFDIK